MQARWYEVIAGDFEDEWSFYVYATAPADGVASYCVRVCPRGCCPDDRPRTPLYPSLASALAAVPVHVAEAAKKV
ncbi:MAG: hypothetical protein ACJ78Q_04085 [Chloroflexia bacterium]